MVEFVRSKLGWSALAFLLFAGAHWTLARPAVVSLAPTYDEPLHLTAGYVYLKTKDYRVNGTCHTPFGEIWAALPLLAMKPVVPKQHPAWLRQVWNPSDQYQFADMFLFKNRVEADRMMEAARNMQVVMSILLGAAVALAAGALGGPWASFFAAGAWAFSPSMLANGTLVSTDIAFALFFFGFFMFLLRAGTIGGALATGILLGLSLGSKYFTLSVGPIAAAVCGWEWFHRRTDFEKGIKQGAWIKSAAIISISFAVSLAAVYQFTGFDIFFEGLKQFYGRSNAGRSSFFWGRHGAEGWLLYFPFAFVVKSPIPFLISMAVALGFLIRKEIRVPSVLWIPPVIFLLITCVSKVQIGHRYILAVYPFLFVLTALALASQKWTKIGGCFLLLATAIGTWKVKPHYIAYFNELIGGPSQGYKYLTDSNVDWGQGLKLLRNELEETDLKNGIYLSYFGVVDPHVYGLIYKDVGSDRITGHKDDADNPALKPTKFAISVTNLQSTYYGDRTAFAWLNQYKPWKTVAHSIKVYDFKEHPEALERLELLR